MASEDSTNRGTPKSIDLVANDALKNWGKGMIKLLCTRERCGHEWDISSKTPVDSGSWICDWCGFPGKEISRT